MSGLWMLWVALLVTVEDLPAPASAPTRVARDTQGTVDAQDASSVATAPRAQAKSEPLPAPKSLPTTTKSSKYVAANVDMAPQSGADTCKIGWGIDKTDNTLYMVVQILPEAIAAFAAGPRGQELPCQIPAALRGRVEKVIIRVGNGPVEQNPPESELVRWPVKPGNSAHIANLDMRSPVSIDAPRTVNEVVTTASTTQLPGIPGFSSAPTPTNEVLPTTVPPATPYTTSTPILSTPLPSTGPTSAVPGLPSTAGSPSVYAANPATNPLGTVMPPSTTSAPYSASQYNSNDGFQPSRTVPSTLNPFGTSRTSSVAAPPSTSTQGNVTYNTATPTNAPTTGYNYPQGNVPMMANNTNPTLPAGWSGQDPNHNNHNNSAYPYNNYASTGNPPYGQPNYNNPGYVSTNNAPLTTPVLPIPQMANRGLPSTSGSVLPSNSGTSGTLVNARDAQRYDTLGNDGVKTGSFAKSPSLVPFFFVLSLILNIYFGLWLNHLSTKYRHVLGSLRGISAAEMDR